MWIEVSEDRVVVRIRRKSWISSCLRIISSWMSPPDGYKLLKTNIERRARSGRATNLELTYGYCDSRFPRFTKQEAWDFFREEEGDEK